MPRFRRPSSGSTADTHSAEAHQINFMRRESVNGVFALVGLVLAVLVLARIRGWGYMARYHHRPRKGTLASLLNGMIQVLFVLNAVYAFSFMIVAIVEVAYLSRHEELDAWDAVPPPQGGWAYAYSWMAHALAQISLLPQFWHCCLAWLFYAYIVQGRTAAALERVVRERVIWYWLGAVAVAAGVNAVCFYAPPRSPLHRAELPWTASTTAASLLAVLALYVKTMYHWQRGNANPSSSTTTNAPASKAAAATTTTTIASTIPPPPVSPVSSAALRRPLWRLVVLLGFFLAIGTWALVNECRAAATALGGERGPRSTGDMPNILLSIVDALVLGGVLSCIYPSCLQSGSRLRRKQQRALNQRRQQLLMDQQRRRGTAVAERKGGSHSTGTGAGAGPGAGMGLKLPSMSLLRKRSMGSGSLNTSGVALRPRGRLDRQLQIFASTFNAGSTKGSCAALGPVKAWIPRGFDLYVIGIQECMVLPDLAAAVHRHLGGPTHYVACTDAVWSTNGEIGLLLFARAEDAAAGAFEILGGLVNRVNLGISVGVGNLPNKAAVGLACRLHDRTLALVTAHFAADKHGKERPEARVRDAVRSLKEIRLGGECEEVDLQHAFHHTIILGDLNFRVRMPPSAVVEKLAASVGQEKKALARLVVPDANGGQAPPILPLLVTSATSSLSTIDGQGDYSQQQLSGPSAAGPASALARSARLARYKSAVPGLPAPPPFGSQVSLARLPSHDEVGGGDDPGACDAAMAMTRLEEGEQPASSSTASSHGTNDGLDLGGGEETKQEQEQEQQGRRMDHPSGPPAVGIDLTGYYHHRCPLEAAEEAEAEAEAEARRLREWWRWAADHDELSKVMQEGACFHGFAEGPLCFPPSFRWVKGARADYAQEGVSAFEGCYTLLKASEGAKGLRPPSYTDRVLVHSLPDLAEDLAIEEYDVCEAMVGSDHRPVSAALRLTVDAAPSASLNHHRTRGRGGGSVKTRKLVVTFSDVQFVPLAVTGVSSASSSSSMAPAEQEASAEAGEAADSAPLSMLGDGLQRLGSFLTGAASGEKQEQCPAPVPAAEALSALIVHYPLLLEDPAALAAQRKAEELKAGLEQGFALGRRERRKAKEAKEAEAVAAILDSEEGSEDVEAGAGAGGGGGDAPVSVSVSGVMSSRAGSFSSALHLENVHTLGLKGAGAAASDGTATGTGSSNPALSFRVAVHERVPSGADTGTGLPHYAVVRVRDKRKHEIGQSVLCLRDALPRPGRRRGGRGEDDDGEEEDAEEERGAFLEASVCDGGRLVGRLLLRAEVLTEEEERRRRKKELQQRVGFLASATATIRGLAHGIQVGAGGGQTE